MRLCCIFVDLVSLRAIIIAVLEWIFHVLDTAFAKNYTYFDRQRDVDDTIFRHSTKYSN